MINAKQGTCKGCIGNISKYSTRCFNCCEYDNHMTRAQVKIMTSEIKKHEQDKKNKRKGIQLDRIKFLCEYIKSNKSNALKTRQLDDGLNITALDELKTLSKMRKNKDFNKIY